MRFYLLVFAPLFVLGGLWTWRASSEPSREEAATEVLATFLVDKDSRGAEIDVAWQNLRMFRTVADRIMKEVAEGHVSLRHAATQIISAAEQWNEHYLLGIDLHERGASRPERAAWNIYRHFGFQHHTSPTPQTRLLLEHLERELQEITGKQLTPVQQIL